MGDPGDRRWYRDAFGPVCAAFWTALIPDERVADEARFLAGVLAAPAGARLLDVPCGAGRQARALGRLGFVVDGVDITAAMLAAGGGAVAGVTLRQGDLTALDARDTPDSEARYGGAYCWGNSFGYVSDEESRAFLRAVARALQPGARFVLDAAAVAENVLAAFQPRTELERDGFRFLAERRYDLAASTMQIHYRIERAGDVDEFDARQAVYTAAELLRMARDAGFAVESLHGGIAGEPAAHGRPLIAVFRRERR